VHPGNWRLLEVLSIQLGKVKNAGGVYLASSEGAESLSVRPIRKLQNAHSETKLENSGLHLPR
jgi:hypothetical protein